MFFDLSADAIFVALSRLHASPGSSHAGIHLGDNLLQSGDGIVGFGNCGQFLANAFSGSHDVSAMSRSKRHHATASSMGLTSYFTFDDAAGFGDDKVERMVAEGRFCEDVWAAQST